jgi:hypothetical protein
MDSTQPPRHKGNPNPCLPDFIHHRASTDTAGLETKHKVSEAIKDLDTSIGTAPAYDTRQREGVFYPSPKTFTDAYKVIEIGSMPNKTKETSSKYLIVQYGPTGRPFALG